MSPTSIMKKGADKKYQNNVDRTQDTLNLQDKSSDQDIHPPFTSGTKPLAFELQDQDGQKYLSYKSMPDLDDLPRIRRPTPERKQATMAAETNDDINDNDVPDCGKCKHYKDRYLQQLNQNKELQAELEKVQKEFDLFRIQQKVQQMEAAKKTGAFKAVDLQKPFSVRDLKNR